MLLSCNNRGCFAVDYHRLDLTTGDVLCVKCQKPVNVTKIAKSVLKSSQQVVKTVRSENELTCANKACGATGTPFVKKYSAVDYRVYCNVCGEENKHQTKFFADVWRQRSDIEVRVATPEERLAKNIPMRFNKVNATELSDTPVENAQEDLKAATEKLAEKLVDDAVMLEPKVSKLINENLASLTDMEHKAPEPQDSDEVRKPEVRNQKVDLSFEENARKRAMALVNADPVVLRKPPIAGNITESDIVVSGLVDFSDPSDE